MEKIEKNAEGASTKGTEYAKIAAEVSKAVEQMPADVSTDKPEDANPAPADDPAKQDGTPPEKDGGEGDFTVGDAEIERAVRAGLSVADARAFKDKAAFERVCSMLEKNGGGKASADNGKGGEGGGEKPLDFDVPELTEDEDFDPKVVKLGAVVKQMGGVLKSLMEENKSLREQVGKSAEGKAAAAKEAAKAAELEKRNALRLAPPGGQRGQRKEKSEDEVMAEVASEISSKFGI